jgi:hypothetical protein
MGNFTGSKEVTVEIIPKKLTVVEVRVEDKGYDGTTTGKILEVVLDGLGTGSVEVDYAASTAEFATPEVGQNKTVTGTIYLTGTNAPNYEAPLNYTATGNIFNDFYAQQGKEYTVNTNDWTNGNFEVRAAEGFTVSTVPNGTFGQSVAVDEEGEVEITFYVKRLSDGRISNPVKETYRIDKTAPTCRAPINARCAPVRRGPPVRCPRPPTTSSSSRTASPASSGPTDARSPYPTSASTTSSAHRDMAAAR